MRIIRDLTHLKPIAPGAVTVGTFDGVHLGHQSILQTLKELGKGCDCLTTIVTFEPHPRKVLGKNSGGSIELLTSINEKLALFRALEIDQVVMIRFTKEFASLSAETFVKEILLDRLAVKEMVIGYDHHFGRNREGTLEKLKELGNKWNFDVHQVPPLLIKGEVVSSSAIRKLLKEGDIEKANRFLGRQYCLVGKVVQGDGRGRKIGFPTANLQVVDPDKLIPARGVYAVDVWYKNQLYKGMMNIGVRPTFDHDPLTLEVHIFNFDNLLYGETLEVRFKKFIRSEQKFKNIEELKKQLEKDKQICETL
ncbi:MAG: bifunctional riboflavin kinase/FAD synthetase [Calditrichaeota bacterium]|nr:MAG: bifunctional riboflavin kinase/FAD synthetase [Calditrichota bacterium]